MGAGDASRRGVKGKGAGKGAGCGGNAAGCLALKLDGMGAATGAGGA